MHELLPQEWIHTEREGEAPLPSCRHKFLDVIVWAVCFASYISVIANKDPSRVPDLLGYLVHMIKASLEFEGPAWANYDNTFRRQAAVLGNQNWSSLNSSLFSMCFTGKGKNSPKCDICLGVGHGVGSCPFREEGGFEVSSGGGTRGDKGQGASQWPRCRRFNEGNCTFLDCSFRHVCARCNGKHPAIACKRPANDKGGPASGSLLRQRGQFRQNPY